ncbi:MULTISPECIES: L,D-transpeptidase family protein [Marinobacter]|uniref:Murein L,D-transpeptidase n=1 Tax=Marinobacter shengliensis TaxID=1389223 RepID=A0ABV4W1K6_9GAMM|nr:MULTISPECIES: L,D-transpeptidase family protein [Marinobacter]MDX5440767.1 L,D-transpeptidase family protein [Alteromonadaceae bacterium]MAO14812.1 peptidoglycan-binding protein [Marinobacter sp.]MCD1629058.1 L,D-transpeptidase family protein [Marinobacter shengliensis]MDX5334642.1 L,D-transpeptidase family protein [Marinobacter sp.]MDX5385138.1 L,D-transpeptidase family protein [Marinobacter sp.]
MRDARWKYLRSRGLALILLLACPPVFSDDSIINRIEALQAGHPVTVLDAPILAKEALTRFYELREFDLAWDSYNARRQLAQAISEVADQGLNPLDYHHETIAALALQPTDQVEEEVRADLDLVLSDAFLLLSSHLQAGKVNPRTIHAEWTANRQDLETHTVLAQALDTNSVYQTLQQLKPSAPAYQKLVTARRTLTALLGQPWHELAATPTLRPGDNDPRIPEIRRRLALLGDIPSADHDRPDAYDASVESDSYDDELLIALPAFQARHGLEPDGIIGRQTFAALNRLPVERIRQLDASLERWRWLPDDLGDTYVLVNIAGFEMTMVRSSEEILRQRVIVGRPYRQTPVFSDRIRYLVFNPTWTVPRKLMIQDQLPIIRSDPGYLERMNFKVYRGWGADRVEVDPATIDWHTLSANNFPYQLVQEPGPMNALGQIKFMFPNQYDIYLHDTPGQALFGRAERTFSSGCIRVERPFELAEHLLEGNSNWSRANIDRAIELRDPVNAMLRTPIPVHLQYWTVWVDQSGVIQFRNDIYGRDQRLIDALRSDPQGALMPTPRRP